MGFFVRRIFIIICVFLVFSAAHIKLVFGGFKDFGVNLTDFMRHREKRGLIFENGGSAKLVIGPIFLVPFEDPIEWKNLIGYCNFHVGDYQIPSKPLYPWDKWENLYARSEKETQLKPDDSREFLYMAMEYFMSKSNDGNGKKCLLRSICENAQIRQQMDLLGEILNVILTPGKENLDPRYKQAYEMGKGGADCIKYFDECPRGYNFLDRYLEE